MEAGVCVCRSCTDRDPVPWPTASFGSDGDSQFIETKRGVVMVDGCGWPVDLPAEKKKRKKRKMLRPCGRLKKQASIILRPTTLLKLPSNLFFFIFIIIFTSHPSIHIYSPSSFPLPPFLDSLLPDIQLHCRGKQKNTPNHHQNKVYVIMGKGGRVLCIITPYALTIASLVCLIMVGLGCTNSSSGTLNNLYFFRVCVDFSTR